MTSWSLLPVVLVLLCSNILCSLGCDLTQGLQEDFLLLNQMSTSSLVPCLKDGTNFNFPKEALDGSQLQKENATVIVHEMVQQIFILFSQNTTPATWNQTRVIQLLIGLDQQLEQLERCLEQDVEWEESSLGSENPRLALKSYFQGISQYLHSKVYSHCAWEIVRVEIRRLFLFMNKLTRNLRN
ncbi:interferon alpha-16 [Monodelphis domestica]|uniref:Type I interferon 7 n=1 Tax=Monodelphis domestica TaxID=13616 RepID=A8E6F0_MONDO|nr:interferon alpha-16 [Monodelphis domestica]CAM33518.1 TPA: type I interferon 7 [Monodelphis domestica]